MNINIMVNISRDDMDDFILWEKGLFDKKPLRNHTSPSWPGRGERKEEQPEASWLAAALFVAEESISLFPCWLFYVINLA